MLIALEIGATVWALTVIWIRLLTPMLSQGVFAVTNYRDHPIGTAMGLAAMLSVTTATVAFELLSNDARQGELVGATVCGWMFGSLGMVDDVAGRGESFGFRGHLRALRHGKMTSGGVKMFGGLLAGFILTGQRADKLLWVVGACVVALSANLINLFDRAPGRACKVSFGWALLMLVASADGHPTGAVVVIGLVAALLGGDLRERFMIGDTGSNMLGALLGLSSLAATKNWYLLLAVLVALNACSEVVSFSRVIDRIGLLRWLDRLGSLRAS